MSNFTGVTFANQAVSPSDDAAVYRALLPDGILTGCALTYSGYTLTMGSGLLIACGRVFRHPLTENWAAADANSGFARLVIDIDLTKTSTETAFSQIDAFVEYASAEDGFAELVQTDINISGTRYQIEACKVSLGSGGITGIVSQMELSRADGASLNFKVVGGLTQPSGPSENTIWVNTNTKITGYAFAPTAPADLAEGVVWFATGKSGMIGFNAMKKNTIMLYPLHAKQKVSGNLEKVDAQIYISGEWKKLFSGMIYETGAYYTEYTDYKLPSNAVIQDGADVLTLSTVANKTSEVYKVFGPVPLDGINSLELSCYFADAVTSGAHRRVLYVAKSPSVGRKDAEAIKEVSSTSQFNIEATISLDVSALSGEYYVYAGTNTDGSAWTGVRTICITRVSGSEAAASAAMSDTAE